MKAEGKSQRAEGLKVYDKLPQGWAIAKLGDIVNVKNGYAFKSKDYCNEGIKLVRISDIQDGKVSLTNAVSIPLDKVKNDFLIEQGDLLIAMSGATTGKVGIYNNSKPCLQNQRVGNFKIKSNLIIDSKFRNFLIHSLRKEIELSAYGGAQPNISASKLESFEIPLPPLNEQKRIVAKLEKLLTKVNESCDRISRIPTILKRFRQSVLASACSGRLTADWRKSHPNIEPAEELLKRIYEYRKNNKNTKTKLDTVENENIPQKWISIDFGKTIGEMRNGIAPRPNLEPPGTPILRISAVRGGKVDLQDIRYLQNSDKFLDTYSLRENDLLFTRYNGTIDLLGVCGMVRELDEQTFLYPDKLIRVRFDHPFILPQYVELYFQSPTVRNQVTAKSKSSAGQNGISGTDLKNVLFNIPPFEEQKEIVRRVEALFRKCDLIEQRYLKAKAYTDKLTQSILAKAFRGELVPQDPNDEPAEVLLERIREEKTLTEKSSKSKKTSKRKTT